MEAAAWVLGSMAPAPPGRPSPGLELPCHSPGPRGGVPAPEHRAVAAAGRAVLITGAVCHSQGR